MPRPSGPAQPSLHSLVVAILRYCVSSLEIIGRTWVSPSGAVALAAARSATEDPCKPALDLDDEALRAEVHRGLVQLKRFLDRQ